MRASHTSNQLPAGRLPGTRIQCCCSGPARRSGLVLYLLLVQASGRAGQYQAASEQLGVEVHCLQEQLVGSEQESRSCLEAMEVLMDVVQAAGEGARARGGGGGLVCWWALCRPHARGQGGLVCWCTEALCELQAAPPCALTMHPTQP